MDRSDQQPQQPTPEPGDPGYDHTQTSWYTKNALQMTDAEVNAARGHYMTQGSDAMESEWLRRHGLPANYGDLDSA